MRRLIPLLLLATLPAAAAPASSPAADVPPPPTISGDGAGAQAEPEVRIIQKDKQRIEEYRLNGKLYMVKVTPETGIPYYLVDDDGSGNMHQVDPSRRLIIPRWVLLRF